MGKYSLIVIAGFVFAFGAVQSNLNEVGEAFVDGVVNQYHRAQAGEIASSGARMALCELVKDSDWRGWGGDRRDMLGGTSVVTVKADSVSVVGSDTLVFVVTSAGMMGGVEVEKVVTWRRRRFSEYAYFTDSDLKYTDGDTLFGPIHTNGRLTIEGHPVFTGPVTSPNMWALSPSPPADSTDLPQFLGNGSFAVTDSVSFPTAADLNYLATTAGLSDVQFYAGTTTTGKKVYINFQDNYVYYAATGVTAQTVPLPSNGVIHSTTPIHVGGRLDGQVTVVSDQEISIYNDLTKKNTNTFLGLISEKDIVVGDSSPFQDRVIHATMLALGQVTVHSSSVSAGTLTVVGGIAQKTEGTLGNKVLDLEYDERLVSQTPPYYPAVGRGSGTYYPGKVLSWYE